MRMPEDIKVTFIIPKNCRNQNDCSDEMRLAFTNCEQHCGGGLKARWIHEKEYNEFEGLTKKDVFVLTDFDGDLYNKLRATKCLLVGPRCLSCCLTEGTPIPSGPEPVFTVAMRGLVVTASGLSKQQKENIKKKVFWMGGIYNSVLTDETTHLVSDTVLSDKYIKSIEKGIPVMCESWIEAVWEKSLHLNINGASSDFDCHRLPPFANLHVTTSGISRKEKQIIMNLVNDNGGTFSGAFQSETTDVVVLTKEGIGSEKHKAALEYGKACVLPSWIKDSAAKGLALPIARYKVTGASTSSPLADRTKLPDMSLNFSRITGTGVRPPSNFVDETKASDMSTMSAKLKTSQEMKKNNDTSVDREIQLAFENLDMSSIKKIGPIFDGFCIWVTGLDGTCRERAAACISKLGGIRYDCPHERVTHIVCGADGRGAAAALPTVPVLSARWILHSIRAGKALDEAEFLVEVQSRTPVKSSVRSRPEPASPMSARSLRLLAPPAPTASVLPDAPHQPEEFINQAAEDLVTHYRSQPMPEPEKERTPSPPPRPEVTDDVTGLPEDTTEEIDQIFRGMKLEVQGLDEEAICELGAEVCGAGGLLVAAGAGGRHALVPLQFDPRELVNPSAEPVTVFWVKDCLSQKELVPIQYYHRPVNLPCWTSPPLEGVVASLSTYSGMERAFLDQLATLLGATTQLRFCRRNTANALASTHLICPTATGDKYTGAVKWGLPAVTGDWLMECATAGRRVPEGPYLVGHTKAPLPRQPADNQSSKPCQTNNQSEDAGQRANQSEEPKAETTNEQTDKENAMLPPAVNNVPRRGSIPSKEQTPKQVQKVAAGEAENEMSPASRYIAMARQGLLGCSQETPKRVNDLKEQARLEGGSSVRTPPVSEALSTPNLATLSPTTRRRALAVRRGEMPSDPIKTPHDPFEKHISTPDSAFGAALRPGTGRLSPEARKRLWEVVNDLPSKQHEEDGQNNTPLSEIRNRFLAQFNCDAPPAPHENHMAPRKLQLQEQEDTPPAKIQKLSQDQSAHSLTEQNNTTSKSAGSASKVSPAVEVQLQRLSAALSGLPRARRRTRDSVSVPATLCAETESGPESQPNTVGWDDTTPHLTAAAIRTAPTVKRFMLSSNVDNREEIIEMIRYLGGEVWEGAEPDEGATHLLCAAPARSEKMLGSIAAGRWVLHPAYIARSRAHGSFLNEEEYEWGNPLAGSLPVVSGGERTLALAAHRWRRARQDGGAGPFSGVVGLVHVPAARRRLLARLLAAGDGVAVEADPPYNDESITVCFADIKRLPLSERDAAWLKSRRVPVCAPVLLSSYLTDETPPDPVQHCLPDFRPN